MTSERYGDAWVCSDCYFAHHYGVTKIETPYDINPDAPEEGTDIKVEWYAGESDTPCDREPLWALEGFELADNTDCNAGDEYPWSTDTCEHCSERIIYQWSPLVGMSWAHEATQLAGCAQDDWFDLATPSGDTGIHDFSWSSCEGCHSHPGGSRYRLSLWKEEGA